MFWNKVKNTVVPCNTDKGLTECDSISKIRMYEAQLEDVKKIQSAVCLVDKYFAGCFYSNDKYSYGAKCCLIDFFNKQSQRKDFDGYNNYEEKFRDFGSRLDRLAIKTNKINELEEKIKVEKSKLGIS